MDRFVRALVLKKQTFFDKRFRVLSLSPEEGKIFLFGGFRRGFQIFEGGFYTFCVRFTSEEAAVIKDAELIEAFTDSFQAVFISKIADLCERYFPPRSGRWLLGLLLFALRSSKTKTGFMKAYSWLMWRLGLKEGVVLGSLPEDPFRAFKLAEAVRRRLLEG